MDYKKLDDYKDSDFVNKNSIYYKYMPFPKKDYKYLFINIEHIISCLTETRPHDIDLEKIKTEYRNTRKLFLIAINLTCGAMNYGVDYLRLCIDFEYNKMIISGVDEDNFTELTLSKYLIFCYFNRQFSDIIDLAEQLHPSSERINSIETLEEYKASDFDIALSSSIRQVYSKENKDYGEIAFSMPIYSKEDQKE